MKSRIRFSKKKRGIQCLNCEQPISHRDNFCSNCGQVNDELPISIKQFIADFFAGFFSYDSRFFKTFGPLLFKPGRVPKEYIEGKRMKYVNPFQLYLNVTIVFFLLTGIFSALDKYAVNDTADDAEEQLKKDSIDIKDLPIISYDSIASLSTVKRIESQIAQRIDSVFHDKQLLATLKNDSISKKEKDSVFMSFYKGNMNYLSQVLNTDQIKDWKTVQKLGNFQEFSAKHVKKMLEENQIDYQIPQNASIAVDDSLLKSVLGESRFSKVNAFMKYDKEHPDASAIEAIDDLGYEKTQWNVFYYKKSQDINKFKEDEGFRDAYVANIVSKISVALFFLLPIFTLFLSLLYIRGPRNYTEHLVFVFSVQTVAFILLILLTLIDRVFKTDLGTILFIPVFLFYLERALKNFYKQHWLKTIIKFFILNFVYLFLASIGLFIISFLAFIM